MWPICCRERPQKGLEASILHPNLMATSPATLSRCDGYKVLGSSGQGQWPALPARGSQVPPPPGAPQGWHPPHTAPHGAHLVCPSSSLALGCSDLFISVPWLRGPRAPLTATVCGPQELAVCGTGLGIGGPGWATTADWDLLVGTAFLVWCIPRLLPDELIGVCRVAVGAGLSPRAQLRRPLAPGSS